MKVFSKVGEWFNSEVITPTTSKSKQEEINALIDEIHETFYTEVDRLLAEANVLRSEDTVKKDLIEKVNKLKLLGFSNTKECKEAEIEIKRLEEIKSENKSKQKLASAIMYFSTKYPNYKFITEDSVKKICEKYNLVYGKVSRYLGEVPDKNLREIQNFKIADEDKSYIEECNISHIRDISYISHWLFKFRQKNRSDFSLKYEEYYPESLSIAAPVKDFNMEGYEVNNFELTKKKIEIPDPVVLQPVHYQGERYFLIVTAWGQEAQDELVFNEKQN